MCPSTVADVLASTQFTFHKKEPAVVVHSLRNQVHHAWSMAHTVYVAIEHISSIKTQDDTLYHAGTWTSFTVLCFRGGQGLLGCVMVLFS